MTNTQDNPPFFEASFTLPKFILLGAVLAHRIKRILWSSEARRSISETISLGTYDRAQFLVAFLLLLLAVLHPVFANFQDDQVVDGVLEFTFWFGVLLIMALEARHCLSRSAELKICWLVDSAFKLFTLRTSILAVASGQMEARGDFGWTATSAVLSIVISTLGMVQPAFTRADSLDTYETMAEEQGAAGFEKTKKRIEKPSWASIAAFSWINKTLATAYNGRIDEDELRRLQPEDCSSAKRDELMAEWKKETARHPEDPKLYKALLKVFALDFCKAALLRLIGIAFELMGPILLQQLLKSIEASAVENDSSDTVRDFEIDRVDGYMIAVAIAASNVVCMLVHEQWVTRFLKTNAQIRGSLTGMIFRKGFVLSAKGRNGYKIGELISLMSVDASRLGHSMHGLHMLWSAPVMVVVTTGLLYSMVGSSIFVGFAAIVVLLPFNIWVAKLQGRLNKQVMKVKDERSNLMDEVLQGIRIIKYFAWESNFEAKVQEIRSREVSLIWRIGLCTAYIVTVSGGTTMLVALVTFAAYTWGGEELTPSVAFGALAMFKVMEHPVQVLGHMVDMVIEGKTALGRLREFFLADELDRAFYANSDDSIAAEDSIELKRRDQNGVGIEIKNGTFSWPRGEDADSDCHGAEDQINIPRRSRFASFGSMFQSSRSLEMKEVPAGGSVKMEEALRDINLEVMPGQLCMVTGRVGAGKTSLLSAILGDIAKDAGSVALSGKVAYAPQQPWIFNGSLQENILFGADFDQGRYAKVLEVCALEHDVRILPAGDQTEIGEKGVNLSGGQKARISLARAVYQQADVYLLDDPLSAVDVHVSETIFTDCVCSFLRGKTRVLVTHQVQYMTGADVVVNLQDGAIDAQGLPEEVMAQCPHLAEASRCGKFSHSDCSSEEEETRRGSEDSSADTQASSSGKSNTSNAKAVDSNAGVQTQEEELLEASVDVQIWKKYGKALGMCAISFFVVVLLVHELLALSVGWWLSVWSEASSAEGLESEEDPSVDEGDQSENEAAEVGTNDLSHTKYFLAIFALLNLSKNLAQAALILIERFSGLKAGAALHNQMLATVLRVPVEFFDTTPTGRILNRFTSDVHALDRDIAGRLNSFVGRVVEAVLLCVAIGIVNPAVLVIAVPTLGMFLSIQNLFKRGCLQLQRLESITKSPLFAHFSESLNGVSTIRAFGAHDKALATSCTLFDNVTTAWINLIDCHQWLTVRVTSLGTLIILGTSIAAVMVATPSAASAAATGLVISYALRLTGVLQEAVRSFTHSEQSLVSVERVDEYGSMDREDGQQTGNPAQPPPEWPSQGQLSFDDVVMTYRKTIPPALKGMSFSTRAGEKIGIVGRTGAGKSSLAVSLFRLGHITSGAVTLDGVDVATLGVEELRRKLSIIPQDPILFSGSIRSNLDPFDAYTDDEIWAALECVHMKDLVAGYPSGLQQQVAQGGTNLSIGQRQLFCLARALLRRAKVIVMDEATASVDLQTDNLIQDTMKTHFKSSTVLTIAHRLNTVMTCDRVLVLGDGRRLEMGPPADLASDPNSVFYQMVSDPNAEREMLG